RPAPYETHDRFGLPFGAYICPTCGLVFTHPILTNESLKLFYEDHYHSLNSGKRGDIEYLFNPYQGQRIIEFIRDSLGPTEKPILAAEIGAGAGDIMHTFLTELSKEGYTIQVAGTEYSSDLRTQCENLGIQMYSGGIESFKKLNRPVDILVMSHVFEHMVDL